LSIRRIISRAEAGGGGGRRGEEGREEGKAMQAGYLPSLLEAESKQ